MKKSIFFMTLLLVGGCQKADLHHDLSETEAGEILYILEANGIDAKKEKEISGQMVFWKVTVPVKDTIKARQILISNNLPHKKELGLAGVYREKGLIPTPDEQKARFLLALKGEIINSLEKIPGVVEADVVLNVPDENEFSDLSPEKRHPTASVIVKAQPSEDGSLPVTEGKIQRFVANTVPNLNPNDVAVILSRGSGFGSQPVVLSQGSAQLPPTAPLTPSEGAEWVELAGLRIDVASVSRMKVYFIGLLSLLVVVAMALLINVVRLNRLRLKANVANPVPLEGGHQLLGGGGGTTPGPMEGTFDVRGGRNS